MELMGAIPMKKVRIHFSYFASDDMSDAHHVVVNHISKVVSGKSVVFKYDLVIYYAILEANFAMNYVFEFNMTAIWNLHSQNV